MYTWQHGFWVFFLTRNSRLVWQYVAGAMLPDAVYVVLLGVLLVEGTLPWRELGQLSPTLFMGFLPLHPWAQQLDLIGHSVVIWAAALLLAVLLPGRGLLALVIGWGSHLLIDALTHAAYANYFLYPLSLWAVHSPVSYWEPNYFAREFRLVNALAMGTVILYLVIMRWKQAKK